jgi:DNA-nicking Smr family endonuclease
MTLTDLSALKKNLAQLAQAAMLQEQALRECAAAADQERHLFVRSVGPITLLSSKHNIPTPTKPKPLPEPRQRDIDEASVLREALSDDFDVESLLDTDAALSFRRRGVGPEVTRKLRRGVWAIQAQLDLHGLRRDAARDQLAAFFREATLQGLRCVRVIHGKGNGSPGGEPVLKAKVRSWLVQKNEVMAFTQARASDGGNGALLVLLRPGIG